jgi:heme exporter protein CcmB
MGVLRAAWLIARKDFRIEVRSRELIYTAIFFAVACLLIFAFAFVYNGRAIDHAAAGIVWVSIVFAGTLALGRTFERERQGDTLRALLLSPVERPAIYLGKLMAMLVFLTGIVVVILPLSALLFDAPIFRTPGLLAAILATGILGFAAVGTLFSAMLVRASSRDVLLPIVLYPLTLPALIGGMQGTVALFSPEPDLALAQNWLAMLIFFDVVFVILALWTFAPAMRE